MTPGMRYRITYTQPGQRLPRVCVARYLETNDAAEHIVDFRPEAGSAQLPSGWVESIERTNDPIQVPTPVRRQR